MRRTSFLISILIAAVFALMTGSNAIAQSCSHLGGAVNCPHCSKPFGLLSASTSRRGRRRRCPHCDGDVEIYLDLGTAALLFVPARAAVVLLRPVVARLGLPDGVVVA